MYEQILTEEEQIEVLQAELAKIKTTVDFCNHPGCGCVCGHRGECPEDGPSRNSMPED